MLDMVLKGLTLLVLFACLNDAEGADASAKVLKEVDALIVQGRKHYAEVVTKLNGLLDKDKDNAKAIYKRAEVKDLLKEYDDALADLKHLLELNPQAKQGYQLRAKICAKRADYECAWKDWSVLTEIYAASNSNHERTKKLAEARKKVETFRQIHSELGHYKRALAANPDDPHGLQMCIRVLELCIAEARGAEQDKLRHERVECALRAKDYDTTNHELTRILAVYPQDLRALYLKAVSLKAVGASDAALANLKICLGLDPEERDCKRLHKKIRTYAKITSRFEKSIDRQDWVGVLNIIDESFAADEDPQNLDRLHFHKCKAHLETRKYEEGLESCGVAIEISGDKNPSTWEILVMRANIYMINNELEKAEQDLDKAQELQKNERTILEARQRLDNLKRRAARKDYYKILGVKPSDGQDKVKKAFKKLALKYHPDMLASKPASEQEALKDKYRDIAEAKEVLCDPEKRRKYDLGEDLDEQPQQRRGHPFHFQQGGGFSFHF